MRTPYSSDCAAAYIPGNSRDGPNEVEHQKPLPAWVRLWHCYLNPLNLLLTMLAALSYLSGDARSPLVVGLMVALSTLWRFVASSVSMPRAS